ncbi:ribosome small subunit-dependent GTPase A [Enterococcus durans]|uniref:ribosome small subunit-dependent GTPase A n=1 Tax=Enterococcus durans TaxID=53345 RepID=UPI00188424FC|nr:ribosome small subunit-dependent GTPase A [Enterococcus durans]MBE9886739.1 ribosome small subunit-dependent GTPase A [Enterococcus durans]
MINDYGLAVYEKKMKLDTNAISHIGRIIENHSFSFTVFFDNHQYTNVKMSGKCTNKLILMKRNVAIGDFVQLSLEQENLIILDVLPEYTKISKKVSSNKTREQLLATNIDVVLITIACDQKFSLGLLERYLLAFSSSEFKIHLLLTKSDLRERYLFISEIIASTYPELKILPVSIFDKNLDEKLLPLIKSSTVVFIGASGSGKSSLINLLMRDNLQKVNEVKKKDHKGKHTTTNSVILPLSINDSSYLIDTPGIKSIALWDKSDNDIFSDIQTLEKHCKYNNCTHQKGQTDCAILQAIELGLLDKKRFDRYISFQKEVDRRKERTFEDRMKNNRAIKNRQNLKRKSKKNFK